MKTWNAIYLGAAFGSALSAIIAHMDIKDQTPSIPEHAATEVSVAIPDANTDQKSVFSINKGPR